MKGQGKIDSRVALSSDRLSELILNKYAWFAEGPDTDTGADIDISASMGGSVDAALTSDMSFSHIGISFDAEPAGPVQLQVMIGGNVVWSMYVNVAAGWQVIPIGFCFPAGATQAHVKLSPDGALTANSYLSLHGIR